MFFSPSLISASNLRVTAGSNGRQRSLAANESSKPSYKNLAIQMSVLDVPM